MTSRSQQLTGPDRWQISYADLLTLLLGFFIVMYAVSSMEAEKKEQLITALQKGFVAPSSHSPSPQDVLLPLNNTFFNVESHGQWLYLTVASKALFASASAELTASAKKELNALLPILLAQKGIIEVEGHTDNVPIHTSQYPNNWSLSSARAVSVVNFLVNLNNQIEGSRFRAVGFGQYSPIADNSIAEGREKNRRVIIKIEKKHSAKISWLFEKTAASSNASIQADDIDSHNALFNETVLNKESSSLSNTQPKAKNLKSALEERLHEKGIAPQKKNNGGVKFSKD